MAPVTIEATKRRSTGEVFPGPDGCKMGWKMKAAVSVITAVHSAVPRRVLQPSVAGCMRSGRVPSLAVGAIVVVMARLPKPTVAGGAGGSWRIQDYPLLPQCTRSRPGLRRRHRWDPPP